MDPMSTFLLGILATAICAWIPYVRGSRQLSSEAKRLRDITNLVLVSLERAGMVKLSRDDHGAIIGVIAEMTCASTISIHSSAAGIASLNTDNPLKP